jgi:hypothetical protein
MSMARKMLATTTYVVLHTNTNAAGFVGSMFASIVRASGQDKTQFFASSVWPLDVDGYGLAMLRSTGQGCSFPNAVSRLISWLSLCDVDVNSPHARLAVTNNDTIASLHSTVAELRRRLGKRQLGLHPFFNSWVNISDHLADARVPRATAAIQEHKFYTQYFAKLLCSMHERVTEHDTYLSATKAVTATATTETAKTVAATVAARDDDDDGGAKDFWSQMKATTTGEKKVQCQSFKKAKRKQPAMKVKKEREPATAVLKRSEIVKRLQKVLMQGRKIAQHANVFNIAKTNAKRWTDDANQACFYRPVATRVATIVRVVDCGWSRALYNAVTERGQVFTVVCPLRWRGTENPTADFSTFTDMDFDLARRTTFNLGDEFATAQCVEDLHAQRGQFPIRAKQTVLFKPFTKTFSAARAPTEQYLPLNIMPCLAPGVKAGNEEASRRLWSIFITASENNLKNLLIPVDYATRSLTAANAASLCKKYIWSDFADTFDTVVFFRAGSDKKVVSVFKEVLTPKTCKYDGECHLTHAKHWQTHTHNNQLVPFLKEPELV